MLVVVDSAMQQPSIDDDDMYPVGDPYTVTDDSEYITELSSRGSRWGITSQ